MISQREERFWRRPAGWLLVSVLATACTLAVWLVGAFAGGLDPGEACGLAGQPYDPGYRSEHWREHGRVFPLHDRCSADYDLVPFWVNPALVVLTAVAVGGIVLAVVRGRLAIRSRMPHRGARRRQRRSPRR